MQWFWLEQNHGTRDIAQKPTSLWLAHDEIGALGKWAGSCRGAGCYVSEAAMAKHRNSSLDICRVWGENVVSVVTCFSLLALRTWCRRQCLPLLSLYIKVQLLPHIQFDCLTCSHSCNCTNFEPPERLAEEAVRGWCLTQFSKIWEILLVVIMSTVEGQVVYCWTDIALDFTLV